MCPLSICVFLEQYPSSFVWLIIILLFSVCIFWTLTSHQIYDLLPFSLSVACLFILLIVCFHAQKFWIWMESSLSTFTCVAYVSGITAKNILPNLMWSFPPYVFFWEFYSSSFYISGLQSTLRQLLQTVYVILKSGWFWNSSCFKRCAKAILKLTLFLDLQDACLFLLL